MNDRLNDLRKGGGAPSSSNGGTYEEGGPTTSPGGTYSLVPRGGGENTEATFMNDFFQCVEMIKSNIVAIQVATKRVSEIRENVVLSTMAEKEAAYSAELNPLLTETNKKATFIKNMLKRSVSSPLSPSHPTADWRRRHRRRGRRLKPQSCASERIC
jgi:hypothetical protein